MAATSGEPVDLREAANRAVNLVAATVLGLVALTFGSEVFNEVDPIDKVDNTLILIVGVACVAWYFLSRNWAKRSVLPLVFAGAALGAQIVGIVLEYQDPVAFGDDIPGMILFVPFLVILAVLYRQAGRVAAPRPA